MDLNAHRVRTVAVLLAAAVLGCAVPPGLRGEEEMCLLLSPLVGWDRNELTVPAGRGMTVTMKDTAAEYGLFALFVHPRVAVNNMLFYTDPNDAEVTGDMLFVNVYGDPRRRVTWNAGVGYLWHAIETDALDITISVPMLKAGAVLRWRKPCVSLNPYLAYTWDSTETDFGDENTESVLYGLTAAWRWRMLGVTLKYYLDDNQDRNEQYNVLRARAHAFLSETFGMVVRAEYMEHSVTTDTSFLIGPAVRF
ncbi:MAG: hypothetical protein JXR37_19770 [Kiritimatiellae bacterium]|nr:hypothetical protein [Kiritimatiellia bacterium]